MGSLRRKTCRLQVSPVPGIEEGVVDMLGKGIELLKGLKLSKIVGTPILGEVVQLEQKRGAPSRQKGDHLREHAILAERMIVKVPKVWRGSQVLDGSFFQSGQQRFGGEGGRVRVAIIEGLIDNMRKRAFALVRRPGQDEVGDSGLSEALGLRLKNSGDSTGAEMVVDEGDGHRWRKQR